MFWAKSQTPQTNHTEARNRNYRTFVELHSPQKLCFGQNHQHLTTNHNDTRNKIFQRFLASVSKPWGFLNNSAHFLKRTEPASKTLFCENLSSRPFNLHFFFHQGTWGRGSRGGVGLSVVIRAPREVVPEAVAACPWSIIYVDHAECAPLMS